MIWFKIDFVTFYISRVLLVSCVTMVMTSNMFNVMSSRMFEVNPSTYHVKNILVLIYVSGKSAVLKMVSGAFLTCYTQLSVLLVLLSLYVLCPIIEALSNLNRSSVRLRWFAKDLYFSKLILHDSNLGLIFILR